MSYDLFITPDAHERDVIADWFASRRNYQVSGDQIWYANDAGVVIGVPDLVACHLIVPPAGEPVSDRVPFMDLRRDEKIETHKA